jgi:putative flippase GtrA
VIRQYFSTQFLFFLLTGGFAALVNIGSRIAYNRYWSFSVSIILAYITGMVTAFILARIFVFKDSKQAMHRSVIFFILVNIAAATQTWLISMGLDRYLLPAIGVTLHVPEIAHIAGVIFPVFTSYLGHKRWSFQ